MEKFAVPALAPGAAANLRCRANASACLVASLTDRQRDVLRGMVDGLLNKQIAVRLRINEKTVKMHRAALLERLRVSNSAAAVRVGVEAEFALALCSKAPLAPIREQQVALVGALTDGLLVSDAPPPRRRFAAMPTSHIG